MFLILILFILSPVAAIASSCLRKKEKSESKLYRYTPWTSICLQLVALVLSFRAGNGLPAAALALLVADALISFSDVIVKRFDKKLSSNAAQQRFIRAIVNGIAAVLVFEVFICNFGTYSLMLPGSPDEKNLPISESLINGVPSETDKLEVLSQEAYSVSFENVQSEIQTIYADISLENAYRTSVSVSNNDETSQEVRTLSSINYIHNNELSKYIVCSFFGNVDKLSFYVHADTDSSIVINSIKINAMIPFQFSWIRFLIILTALSFFLSLVYSPAMKSEAGTGKTFGYSMIFLTAVFVLIGFSFFFMRDDVLSYFKNPDLNQINKELVDAFRAGQVSLLDEPSEELLALSNPYDNSLRSQGGMYYLWDHLLFEGKYYSYYGIGTVLTLFLPYNLITGNYFPSLWATLIYSQIGILFLSLSYYVFVKRFFPKISNGIAACGLIIVQSTSFVWYCITIGNFYELAQVSGFAFLISGTFFLLRSGVIGKGKISRRSICVSTILLSIAVLCRAALALYCVVSLIFIYAGVKKILSSADKHTFKANKKPVLTFLAAAMIPYIIIGSVQMVYNYMRFGSVLDFGISYTLTIYDYQHITFQFPLMLIAIYNYLFTLPRLNAVFPFVTSNYESLSVNGYYFLAGFSSAGIIFRATPVLGYGLFKRAYRNSGSERRLITSVIVLGCLVVPFVQMALIWEYGYTPRYAVDFAWQMIFGAFTVLFVTHRSASKPVKKVLYGGFAVSAFTSFVINMALAFEAEFDYLTLYRAASVDTISHIASFGRLFEFWNMM